MTAFVYPQEEKAITTVTHNLVGGYRKVKAWFFSKTHSDRTRGNEHKLQLQKDFSDKTLNNILIKHQKRWPKKL